jgi:hypothetical protein
MRAAAFGDFDVAGGWREVGGLANGGFCRDVGPANQSEVSDPNFLEGATFERTATAQRTRSESAAT